VNVTELARETVAHMAREVAGLELADEELDCLLPYVRAQLANVAKLEALAATLVQPQTRSSVVSYAK